MTRDTHPILLQSFTDPMMGLSYEMEPIFRRLETHYPNLITFQNCMALLVRDVYDFVNPADLALGKEIALERYLPRLAAIYRAEEAISHMPICMEICHLFDTEHTSTWPLNLAYKAVERVAPNRAQQFLYALRFATVVECRQTTRAEEIKDVVRQCSVNEEDFLNCIADGRAEKDLLADLALCRHYRITGLPAYRLAYKESEMLLHGVLPYETFTDAIAKLTDNAVAPQHVSSCPDALFDFIKRHPLISPIELKEAFDLPDTETVRRLLKEPIANGALRVLPVCHGYFFSYHVGKETV
ncbi:MAG: DsbA family protein [Desulfovibrionaceae bacterium]|nr:DsbA family protein [Desulfovibrionaceae bacterium]